MICNSIRRYRSEKCKSFVRGSRILDIGCSDGDFMSLLKGRNIVGIDIDRARLKKAKRYGPVHRVSIFDYFPDGKFDTIICSDVIEHINNDNGKQKKAVIDAFMKKVYGLLNDRGLLILSFPFKPHRTHPQFVESIPSFRGFALIRRSYMPVPILFGEVDNERCMPAIRKNPFLRALHSVVGPLYVAVCCIHGKIKHNSILLVYEKRLCG